MTQSIELTLPAWGDFLFLARSAVGAVAARVGMTVEEIEDLNLAVDELCLSLIGPEESKEGRLELSAEWDDREVTVRCHLEAPGTASDAAAGFPDEISERIIGALTDRHGLERDGTVRTGWLTKRRSGSPSGV